MKELNWLDDGIPLAIMSLSFGLVCALGTLRCLEKEFGFKAAHLVTVAALTIDNLKNWKHLETPFACLDEDIFFHYLHQNFGSFTPDDFEGLLENTAFFDAFYKDCELMKSWVDEFLSLTTEERTLHCPVITQIIGANDICSKGSFLQDTIIGTHESIAYRGDHFFWLKNEKIQNSIAEDAAKSIIRWLFD
jgi:hypothetical protein